MAGILDFFGGDPSQGGILGTGVQQTPSWVAPLGMFGAALKDAGASLQGRPADSAVQFAQQMRQNQLRQAYAVAATAGDPATRQKAYGLILANGGDPEALQKYQAAQAMPQLLQNLQPQQQFNDNPVAVTPEATATDPASVAARQAAQATNAAPDSSMQTPTLQGALARTGSPELAGELAPQIIQQQLAIQAKSLRPATAAEKLAGGYDVNDPVFSDAFHNLTSPVKPKAEINQELGLKKVTPLAPNDPRLPAPNLRIPGAQYGTDAAGNVVVTNLSDAKSTLAQQQAIADKTAGVNAQMAMWGITPPGAGGGGAGGASGAAPGAPGAASAAPVLDPTSNNLTAQTGLPDMAIKFATGQMTGRSSMMQAAAVNQLQAWGIKHKMNIDTLKPQATAAFNVLQNNIQRNNQAAILENEIQGSVGNLAPILDAAARGRVNFANVVNAWGGKQVNDPTAVQIADQLSRFREELAGYNAVAGGHLMENGTPAPTPDDYKHAENIISTGINSGSAKAISDSVAMSAKKNSVVLQDSIDNANKRFYSLFGATYHTAKDTAPGKPGAPNPQDLPRGGKVIKYDATGKRIQ